MRDRREFADRARVKLGGLGLTLEGDLLDRYTLRGTIDAIELEYENRTARVRPGARDGDAAQTVCAVRFPLDAPDLIVCRVEDVDLVMGPLPSVPRMLTGHSKFDNTYGVFASTTTAEPGASYRAAPVVRGTAWAHSEVVERLCELKLHWLRVRDGRCEACFELLEPEDVVRAVTTCTNFTRATNGVSLAVVAAGDRMQPRDPMVPWGILWKTTVVGFLWSLVLVFPLAHTIGLPLPEACVLWVGAISLIACVVATHKLSKQRRTLGVS